MYPFADGCQLRRHLRDIHRFVHVIMPSCRYKRPDPQESRARPSERVAHAWVGIVLLQAGRPEASSGAGRVRRPIGDEVAAAGRWAPEFAPLRTLVGETLVPHAGHGRDGLPRASTRTVHEAAPSPDQARGRGRARRAFHEGLHRVPERQPETSSAASS